MVYCCRYYAVVHPMKAQYLCTTSQAKKVTILVWLLAVILSLPTAIVYVSIMVFYPTIGRQYFVKTQTYVALFGPRDLPQFFSNGMYIEVSPL